MKDDGRFEELKHQGTDFQFPAIIISVVIFVVIGAFIQLGVWWFYRYVRQQDQNRDVRRTFVEAAPPIPPEPRLQVDPQEDFDVYFRKEQEVLKSYGWTSRSEGKVHIPIDRAMELFVERQKRQ